MQKFYPETFKREELKLSDGGTVGIDWDGDIPSKDKPLEKPLLILLPGLGGATNNLYTLSLLKQARE